MTPSDVIDRPWAYDFHAAAEVLAAAGESVRFRGHYAAGVATDLAASQVTDDWVLLDVAAQSLGELLPAPFHRALAEEEAAGGATPLRDFLDAFQHRLLVAGHDVWRAYRPELHPEPVAEAVLNALGVRPVPGVSASALAAAAPLLAVPDRPAAGLEQVIEIVFGVPSGVVVRSGGKNRFRVVVGPVTAERYETFLPGGADLPLLVRLIRLYAADAFAFDLRVRLADGEPSECVLGVARLDWAAWLGPTPRPSGVVSPSACAAAERGTAQEGR